MPPSKWPLVISMTLAWSLVASVVAEPSTAAVVSSFVEAASNVLKLAGLVSLAYVIVMGLSFRAGGALGRAIEKGCRKAEDKPNLKLLTESTDTPLFWKDPALVQGGLRGLVVMAILAMYVVLMLAFGKPPASLLAESTGILMSYPNVMAAFYVTSLAVFLLRKGQKKAIVRLIALLSLGAAVGSGFTVVAMVKTMDGRVGLGIQFVIFTAQSWLISYLSGVFAGVQSTRFEDNLPLVEVRTIDGETIGNVRLLKTTHTECRFVEADGRECLIPKERIQRVRAM